MNNKLKEAINILEQKHLINGVGSYQLQALSLVPITTTDKKAHLIVNANALTQAQVNEFIASAQKYKDGSMPTDLEIRKMLNKCGLSFRIPTDAAFIPTKGGYFQAIVDNIKVAGGMDYRIVQIKEVPVITPDVVVINLISSEATAKEEVVDQKILDGLPLEGLTTFGEKVEEEVKAEVKAATQDTVKA